MDVSGLATQLSQKYLEQFVVRANDVIYFKLVQDEKDLEEDIRANVFNPEFTHQFFGDNENIFGYRGLQVKLFYGASTLTRYISMAFSEKVSPAKSAGVEADEVLPVIVEKLEGSYLTSIDKFSQALANESKFVPFGEKLHEFSVTDKKLALDRSFVAYKSDMSVSGFREYHDRIRTFLLWFIDGASYIDDDDDRWDYFTVFEKVQSGNAESRYNFAGMTTVYRYYAYPQKIRPRISQVLVLPPFQRKGVGAEMLQTIYNYYLKMSDVLDITVEDPSDNFVKLRDYVDCKLCRTLPEFSKENLAHCSWSEKLAATAQEKLKLNKKQTRRVYEILKLASIDRCNNEQYKQYRLEVKNRLNAPFARPNRGMEKQLEEEAKGMNTKEIRIEELKNLFSEVEGEYLEVIEKLAAVL